MASTLYDAQRLAATYGVSPESLRLYERHGLLRPVRIGEALYYTPKDRVRLEIVLTGKRLGFSLAEIERMLSAPQSAPPPEGPGEAPKLDLDRLIEELQELTGRRVELDALVDALQLRRGDK